MIYPPLWSADVERRIRENAYCFDPNVQPTDIVMCKRCVMTNQRPRITFDEEGICSACRYAERKHTEIDWSARRDEFEVLLSKHRGNGTYDVIVPCSGGKDSAAVAWRLKHDHRMRPLCVTWAPFMYTDIGRRNMEAFVHSGFDVVTATPNGLMHRRLARLALEYLGDPFDPFVYGQLCWPMHAALRFGVPLVMFGENGDLEYSGNRAAENKPCWDFADWERVYMKGAGVNNLLDIGVMLGAFTPDEALSLSTFYRLPPIETLKAAEVAFHWFGYYNLWHPQDNYYVASEHCGFQANEERSEGTYSKYASLDDKLDGLHYYFGYLKFGIGRCTSDAAHEIRDGDLEREEGLALVGRYDGEYPRRNLDDCLSYLGVDRDHLGKIEQRFRHAQVPHNRAA